MTEQESLVGVHPSSPHIYGVWLNSRDMPIKETQKHRSLTENIEERNKAIDQLANWIIKYHIHSHTLDVINKRRALLDEVGLEKLVDQLAPLPNNDTTQKGNLGEIFLIEYLKESRKFITYVYKLHYNPNTSQSMKGDDVLMFNPVDIFSEVLYGESKFRNNPSKKVVQDIVDNLEGNKRLPVSMEFVANRMYEMGEKEIADNITLLHLKIANDEVPVTNVGFLLSSKSEQPSKDTFSTVEKHLKTTNKRLVMISLGVDNPEQIVTEAFSKAETILKSK